MTFLSDLFRRPVANPRDDLYASLLGLGLGNNLRLCMDFGSELCWPGSGQEAFDLTPNDSDYYLGTTSGSESQDPTFNGTVGRRTAADYMRINSGGSFTSKAHYAWADALHRAGAAYSVLGVVRPVLASTANASFFTTSFQGGSATIGVQVLWGNAGNRVMFVTVGNNTTGYSAVSGASLSQSAFNIVLITVEQTAPGVVTFYNNGVKVAGPMGYSATPSYSAGTPGGNSEICDGDNGDLFNALAVWDRVVTIEEYQAIWAALRGKYSL